MSISPQKFREIVFLTLFSEITGHPEEKASLELYMEILKTSPTNTRLAYKRALSVMEKFPELDDWIAKFATSYDFERIQTVEKTALRLGAFELLEKEIPAKAAIAEALRLTKKFSTPQAVAFVHAILDKLYETIGK